ncbi:MAG TPA: ABC transporter substrate-binding protein [Stellaceae bacterium]|jgi:peptide/nickel transport system substrate-binding protein|nr:ABC transporter substrate-binding protein [Stellaceae bacterium]
MRTVRCAAALLVIVLTALPAAGATTLRIGLQEDPDALDPAQGVSFVGREVFAALCDKLVDVDREMKLQPQLATEWSWSPDAKALTLKLRGSVKFHDGTALDGAAVKTNIDRYRGAPESKRKSELKAVTNVVAVDPQTVRIELTEPYAPLLAVLADRSGMIMSPAALAKLGDKIGTAPVCSGPYKFAERVAQEKIVVERFPDYWNKDAIGIDRIDYVPVPDATVRLANLQSGRFDIIERMAATDVKAVAADPKLQVIENTALAYNLMSINTGNGAAADNPLGKDERVREAFELAIDRKVLNDVVFEGRFVPSNQPEAPGSRYWDADHPAPGRDVAKAKALLAEAGVPHPSFTLTAPNNTTDLQVAQTMQSMAAEAGFDMRIQATEAMTMVQNTSSGNYQAALAIWSGRPDPDGNISYWIACDGFLNWGKYCKAELDKALAAGRGTVDPGARAKFYREAADIYLADRPVMFLYHYKWLWGVSRKVQGFTPNPDGIIRPQGIKMAQ